MSRSKIEWTHSTWPVVTGCTPVSTGCANCYAARMAATRLKHHPRYEGLATIKNGKARWTGEVRLNHDVLEQPLHWRKPRMVFVASMGDLFHKDVPDAYIDQVFCVMAHAYQHKFQLLTKRPKRMATYIAGAFDRISALLYNSSYGQRIDLYRHGTFWGDRDRFPGADMETKETPRARSSPWGWLPDRGTHQPLLPSPSGVLPATGVSPHSTDGQWESNCHRGTPGSMGLLQQTNPRRSNNQSQEWYQRRQPPREPGVDDVQRAAPTCPGGVRSKTSSPNRIQASENPPNRKRCDQNSGIARVWRDGQGHCDKISDEAKGNLSDLLSADVEAHLAWPLPNVWLGVSVENQTAADERIPWLLQTPAAVHYVSVEPMLAPVDLHLERTPPCSHPGCYSHVSHPCEGCGRIGGRLPLDWVICGGESGPGARPMHPDWVRSLRDQCQIASVPFFFKQWGAWMPVDCGDDLPENHYANVRHSMGWPPMARVGKKRAGHLLDGRTWQEFPVSARVGA